MTQIGYARVSTDEQSTASQAEELRAAGCTTVHEEHGSGGSRSRPALNRLVRVIAPGDTLVVVRLDRLARSLSHLLEVIEQLDERGAFFRSLRDPVDTSSPQGKFTLQVLGAAAELERSLIRDRTRAGLVAARREGRVGGNPGLRTKDPEALRKLRAARGEAFFERLEGSAQDWVPEVRRLRPQMPWEDVARIINARLPTDAKRWTSERLKRAAKTYVAEHLLEAEVLDRAPPRPPDDRLMVLVAAIAGGQPDITLAGIAERLEQMRERTPRGRSRWSPSSVKMLLDRARQNGLLLDG
ncbi:TonB-denpendent receptor [Roseivivax halodurans JCM 10272]|uniref:TonB-denpendent receptor n=1 Tax=Roseivivax halodurans JCM 10272 TaxID=1449350 RepID=X7EBV6_9RHOB|nr:recombinase family protein [Roseivivax halodurans]ETX13574.1 TonB-denpendent receptor [Roseivivax halodurans JCM 10272]